MAKLFALPVPLAVGLILVSACPGGTASNLVTLIAQVPPPSQPSPGSVNTCNVRGSLATCVGAAARHPRRAAGRPRGTGVQLDCSSSSEQGGGGAGAQARDKHARVVGE